MDVSDWYLFCVLERQRYIQWRMHLTILLVDVN